VIPERYVRVLAGLTRAQGKAWTIIASYVKETGRQCFTYNDLVRYWKDAPVPINALTLDRRLRELARMGLLGGRPGHAIGRLPWPG